MQTITSTAKDGYLILQMNRPKVNAINQQMINELLTAIREAEKDEGVGGMILTGMPHIFSAGLDVKEIFGYNEADIRTFFHSFGDLHKALVQFTKPLICAINGHSPAGGTVLAVAADYRIMAEGEKFLIGLNEMAVNIQITQTLVYAYGFWLGTSTANEFLLDGKLMAPEEAQSCGLVNQVVPQEEVVAKAEQQMRKYLAADPDIFANTKRKIRKEWLAQVAAGEEAELEEILRLWWKPSVRARMEALVNSLGGR